MYADYTFYTTQYYGTAIAESDFPRLATLASDFIDMYTIGRAAAYVAEHTDDVAVKKCCCALAENFQIIHNSRAESLAGNGEKASESVGSYSVSYRSGIETSAAAESGLAQICRMYLSRTGLLYRGGVACVHSAHCHSL